MNDSLPLVVRYAYHRSEHVQKLMENQVFEPAAQKDCQVGDVVVVTKGDECLIGKIAGQHSLQWYFATPSYYVDALGRIAMDLIPSVYLFETEKIWRGCVSPETEESSEPSFTKLLKDVLALRHST